MKTIKTLLVVCIFLASAIALGNSNPPKVDEPPHIEVTGTAEMNVFPNEIYISIVLRERYDRRVKVTIEQQEEQLLEALGRLGIDRSNLYLTGARSNVVTIRRSTDVMTKKDYTLKLSDVETVGNLFAELDKLEITEARIARVENSQIDSLRREVRIMAIKAAKNKADYLLEAIGEETGKALLVREHEERPSWMGGSFTTNIIVRADLPQLPTEDTSGQMQFQAINIRASVYVKFGIK